MQYSDFISVLQNGSHIAKVKNIVTYFEINPVFPILQELERQYSAKLVDADDLAIELAQKYRGVNFRLSDNKLLKHQDAFVKFDSETLKQFAKSKYKLLLFKKFSHQQALEFLDIFLGAKYISQLLSAEICQNAEKVSDSERNAGASRAPAKAAPKAKVGLIDRFIKPKQ